MFDMLASKIGEAQAFADGLAANLDVINMDRLLEEQEREEKSKDESLRLLRTSGDGASSPDSAATGSAGAAGRVEREDNNRNSSGALGGFEMPQLGTASDAEQEHFQQPHRSRLSSPNCAASENSNSSSFRDRFASMEEDGGGNFEDEFDPILASIRKPPPQPQPASAAAAKHAPPLGGERQQAPPLPGNPEHDTGRPSAGSTFAASFLSALPGDMRAKAGEVMAQSSARIAESANAFRSALDPGRAAPSASDKFKRRQSDPTYGGGNSDLEDGRGGKGGGRRAAAGEGDEDEVRLMNVNELLSEEERLQLASYSGGAGGAGTVCGWRRLRKYIPVFVGIGLLGLFYLWRWTTLLVGSSANGGVETLGSERV